MKVSTRTISGFGILMVLAFVALGYQLKIIHQMQSINRDLSAINFHAASTALRMVQNAETIGEFSAKYFVLPDPYLRGLESEREEFLRDLAELAKTVRSERERNQVQLLAKAFDDYWRIFSRVRETNQSKDLEYLPPSLSAAINHVQAQTDVLYDAIQVSIREQVQRATEAGQKAEWFSWAAGGLAIFFGIIVAILTVRAIHQPLRRLTQGTRALSKGQFWHRLPDHGSSEFSELARDFNLMAERLGELDQMKKDFVSHVSHDLKAPLASIRQVMHLLLEEIPGSLNDQQKSLLRLSYNSAERLAAMVGNLLDAARVEAGTMEYDMAARDLVPLIRTVIDEFEVQAQEKGMRLRLESEEPSMPVECDRERIMQVIGNLLENALKFSPNNSEIVTRISKGTNGSILTTVTDCGPGVPDGHKSKIFRKFHQVKQGKMMAGQGVGLGLAICKTIVEAHHGEIWVEDHPRGGSVFSFILQAAAAEEVLKCGQSV
ncbi:MAG: hypothetical protein DMG13_20345 [Acidobacteria bacterium]|nr:MAG: hypothetical protein DMG13_20345 [Acidobacteriota bacterium]